jgi:hypothetical protein
VRIWGNWFITVRLKSKEIAFKNQRLQEAPMEPKKATFSNL